MYCYLNAILVGLYMYMHVVQLHVFHREMYIIVYYV